MKQGSGTRDQGPGAWAAEACRRAWQLAGELFQALAESEYEMSAPRPNAREALARVTRELEGERALRWAEGCARRAAEKELQRALELKDEIPGLTPAERERLALLAEECAQLTRAVTKVLRHGWNSKSPHTGRENRGSLEREIGNVRAVVGLLLDAGDLRLGELQRWQKAKRGALASWTHYQACSVTREEQAVLYEMVASGQNRRNRERSMGE